MRNVPIRAAAAALAMLFSATASAEVWRWTDDEGNIHYTDDVNAIPEQHRKRAKQTRGAELGELNTSDRREPERAQPAPSTTGPTHIELKESSSSADEQSWRGRFRHARRRVAELEKARAALQRVVQDPAGSGMPVVRDPNGIMGPNPEYERAKARLSETEAELAQAKEDLADLERRAARAAVPLEWRR